MRAPPLLLLLLLTTAPPAHAATTCLTPGADCKQPPMVDAINFATQAAAYGAAFSDSKLMQQLEAAARAKLNAAGNSTPSESQVWKEMRQATERAVAGVVLPPESGVTRDTVSGDTDDGCHIHFNQTHVDASGKETTSGFTPDSGNRYAPNTCKEFLDAVYEHERVHYKSCDAMGPGLRVKMSAQARAAEDAQAYRVQLHSILDAMEASNPACSPTDDDIKKARDSFRKALKQEMKAMNPAAAKGGHK